MYPTNVAIYDLYQEIQGHKGSRKVAKKRRAGNESIVFTQSLSTFNSRLVCNFRHFGAFSELDFKGLSDLKTWMDYFAHILQEVVNI